MVLELAEVDFHGLNFSLFLSDSLSSLFLNCITLIKLGYLINKLPFSQGFSFYVMLEIFKNLYGVLSCVNALEDLVELG